MKASVGASDAMQLLVAGSACQAQWPPDVEGFKDEGGDPTKCRWYPAVVRSVSRGLSGKSGFELDYADGGYHSDVLAALVRAPRAPKVPSHPAQPRPGGEMLSQDEQDEQDEQEELDLAAALNAAISAQEDSDDDCQ